MRQTSWSGYYSRMDEISNYRIYEDNELLEKDIPTAKEASDKAREYHRKRPDKFHEVHREYMVDDFFKKGFICGIEQWKPGDCPDCRMPEGKCICGRELVEEKEK